MRKLIYLLSVFYCCISFGQNLKLTPTKIDSIAIEADCFIGFDGFNNCFYTKNNVLFKKNKDKIGQYKNLSLGKISKVDIQNPLNIVLFYDTFNTIILLDNQLNETQKINLSENSIPILATATGLAFGNRLWIYNSLTQQIGLYDYLKSEYTTITTPFNGNLKQYESDFNYFQWIDENQNWYRCTIYGKIVALGKVPESDSMQIISNSDVIYKKSNSLYYFTLKGNKTTLIDFDKKSFESFYYEDQILSIFTIEGITNYKIKIP